MSYSNVPIYPQTIRNTVGVINYGDNTSIVTIFAGATNGTKIESIILTNTDTSAHDVTFSWLIGSTYYQLTTLSVPASAGIVDNVPCVNVFGNTQFPGLARDANGNPYMYLTSSTSLCFNALTQVPNGKFINAIIQGGDF